MYTPLGVTTRLHILQADKAGEIKPRRQKAPMPWLRQDGWILWEIAEGPGEHGLVDRTNQLLVNELLAWRKTNRQ